MVNWEKEFISNKEMKPSHINWEDTFSNNQKNTQNRNPNPYRSSTDEISTITGKPIEKQSDTNYVPADISTLQKAGWATTNKTKIDIFSKARGISKDRYDVQGGKIWFKGDDGKMYPESPTEISNVIKKFIAEIPSELPRDISTAVGALGGIPGAAAGAMVGDELRNQAAKYFFGDDPSPTKRVIDLSISALLGGVDAGMSKFITSKLQKSKLRKEAGIKIADDVVDIAKKMTPEQRAKGKILKQKGEDIGVDLLPHQTLESSGLNEYYNLLRSAPSTGRIVKESDSKLEEQIFNAGENLISDINSGRKQESFAIKSKLSDLGRQVIERMETERKNLVSGLYEQANKQRGVDITPSLDEIDILKSQLKPEMKAYKGLNRIKKMLVEEKKIPASKILTPDGKPAIPAKTELIKEDRIILLDNIKQEIDLILAGRGEDAINKKMRRQMKGLKDTLTTQTDIKSSEYKLARKLFEAASPKIDKTKKGIIGVLSRMETDKIKDTAIKQIFSSPQSIKRAKKYLQKEDPMAWEDAVAEYMREGFEKAMNKDTKNIGGKYSNSMWNLGEKKKLEIAMDGMKDGNGNPLYNTVSDFFDVMKATDFGINRLSARKSKGELKKELEGKWGKMAASIMFIKQTLVSIALKGKQEKVFNKNSKKLLQLLQTPEGVNLLSNVKGYGPKTEKGIKATVTFLAMATESKITDLPELYRAGKQEYNKN